MLHERERGFGNGARGRGERERAEENVGSGDGILNGEVDADATDGRNGVRGIPDTEQSGHVPAVQVINLHGEKFDLIETGDFVDAAMAGGIGLGEEWNELAEMHAESIEAG